MNQQPTISDALVNNPADQVLYLLDRELTRDHLDRLSLADLRKLEALCEHWASVAWTAREVRQ